MKVVKKILRFLGLVGDRSISSITAPIARLSRTRTGRQIRPARRNL